MPSATTENARIPTPSSSAMVATSLCIKVSRYPLLYGHSGSRIDIQIVMEFLIFPKDNGSVESVPSLPTSLSSVLLPHLSSVHLTDAASLQSCVLCPNSYGAFKQTTTAQWAHLLCAIWVPDTGVSNTVYMEPIDGVENISRNRWKLVRRPSFRLPLLSLMRHR